jgi:hypothetical protein
MMGNFQFYIISKQFAPTLQIYKVKSKMKASCYTDQ